MPNAHPVSTPRRRRPRVDEPPFTGSHWVSRTGMPTRSSVPSGHWIHFKGRLYMAYQTLLVGVAPPAAGPISTNWWAGAIVSTADALTWSTVFVGDVSPSTGHGFRMPGMFYVHDDTLYCVVYQGGYSWVQPFVYLGPGEIAIWKTTDGVSWTKHQVLVSWPAAGAGQNVGGTASGVQFGQQMQTVWRAAGSGPSGETADWLVVSYAAWANVPGAPVSYIGVPQYRSLDGGETWTLVRDMSGVPPIPGGGFVGFPQILPVPRPGVAIDRWVMTGGRTYRSDDVGVSWQPYIGPNSYGVMVPSGGLVLPTAGTATLTPNLLLSCDYAQTTTAPVNVPTGGTNSMLNLLAFPAPIAGGEEMIAVTKRAFTVPTTIWHSTNGGESWADRGDVPTVFDVNYSLARMPTGRLLLYPTGGGPAATDLWTCDDAPTGIPTPRSVCPFVVEPPATMRPVADCAQTALASEPCAVLRPLAPPAPAPVGLSREALDVTAAVTAAMVAIQGCSALTFVTEPCGGIAIHPVETCAAPLGRFLLGFTCLGAPTRPRTGLTGRSLAHVPR